MTALELLSLLKLLNLKLLLKCYLTLAFYKGVVFGKGSYLPSSLMPKMVPSIFEHYEQFSSMNAWVKLLSMFVREAQISGQEVGVAFSCGRRCGLSLDFQDL